MKIFNQLNLSAINQGGCCAADLWLQGHHTHLDSFNPASGEIIASVEPCSEHEYNIIIENSHRAFLSWREVPAPQRGEMIRRIGEILRSKKDQLGNLVAMESGKIKQEADGEVQEMIDMADFAVGQSRMLYGNTMHSERRQHRMYEQWHPLGVVGVITAFNFPVAVWAWNAFIAAIAGNTVIWKPSSKVPLCAVAVQHICNQAMQEMGYQSIFSLFIPENHRIAASLVHDERVPMISFTGSSTTGKHIAQCVCKRLGRYLLEMSGNNAIIVDESADLDLAVPAIVFGSVGTAGQRCTTTRRLIVHQSIFEELSQRLVHAYQQVSVGNPLAAETLMGPLIDASAVAAFSQAMEQLKLLGADILSGGKEIDHEGCFVEPTLVKAKADWPILQQETFAPILYLLEYQELDDAIAMQNDVKQGLSSALFTNNIQHAESYLSAIGSDCGIANINIGTSGAEIGGAFGGEKETGGGREAGSDSWKAYMRRQTCTINWSKELPLAQGIEFKLNK